MIKKLIKVLRNFDINKEIAYFLKQPQYQQFLINTNKNRLKDYGVDTRGNKLKTFKSTSGVYSDYTIQLKKIKGQRTDIVTLKDTGKFYKSFALEVKSTFIEFIADKTRLLQLEENLLIKNILGLTEIQTNQLINMLADDIIQRLQKKISHIN